MSFITDFLEGLLGTIQDASAAAAALYQVESCCRTLEWQIDERLGNRLKLYFTGDPLVRRREITVLCGDNGLVTLLTHSHAIFRIGDVPAELPAFLLYRNGESLFGGWLMYMDDENRSVSFSIRYATPGAALTAELFRYVCTGMVKEAAEFDQHLYTKGWLNS